MPELSIYEDEKKFMWDGNVYAGKNEAENKADAYAKEGFETRILEKEKDILVYTRRVAENQNPEN